MECATANQASQSRADSQSGHGTSGSQESPELHAEDISEEIMNFSLQEISASFSLCINCFFLSLLEKYVSLVIIFHFMPKKCFLSLSAPDLSVLFCLSVHPPQPLSPRPLLHSSDGKRAGAGISVSASAVWLDRVI